MSNLVDHARRELELIGEEPDAFAEMGHSGGSASVAIPVINELLQFKNLKPITDDPDEWFNVTEQSGYEMWQNKRNPECFSHDAGKHYWMLSEGANSRNREPIHESVSAS